VLERSALEPWDRGVRVNLEREIFPALIVDGAAVFGFLSDAYWLDLGTPEKYLQAHADLLDGRVAGEPAFSAPFVDPSASLDPSVRLGRHVVVGPEASVQADADLDESVLLRAARVEEGAVIRRSILGPRSRVGRAARLAGAVLGEAATVAPGADLVDARVSGHGSAG
jgi:mannose-1-phosphate guanylyltransferase